MEGGKRDMSSTKEPWWGYVKAVIREYPALLKEHNAMLEPKITQTLSFAPGGGDNGSPVERCVIHDLPPAKQRKFDAVDKAIQTTKARHKDDYESRLKVIELVYFKRTHTLAGAAMVVGYHFNTCGRISADFIRLVAENLDLP